jgi:hypothetical protein
LAVEYSGANLPIPAMAKTMELASRMGDGTSSGYAAASGSAGLLLVDVTAAGSIRGSVTVLSGSDENNLVVSR